MILKLKQVPEYTHLSAELGPFIKATRNIEYFLGLFPTFIDLMPDKPAGTANAFLRRGLVFDKIANDRSIITSYRGALSSPVILCTLDTSCCLVNFKLSLPG